MADDLNELDRSGKLITDKKCIDDVALKLFRHIVVTFAQPTKLTAIKYRHQHYW
ncbi:hypothetical protein [Rheinheimera sp.]|uniref:hypothetical protein n=1 Tax=Rheinheimera sp. TaxID=1869214 RepID=UPI0040478DB2